VKDGALIAISVNGKVAASARSFLFKGEHWAGSLIPPNTLRQGRNSIGIYQIGNNDVLTPLGGN
jgi:hypothetical protein